MLPLREPIRRTIPRVRAKLRRTTAVRCRPHVTWVLDKFQCALAGKVSKITGKMHVCEGRKDPHHTPTRGAGGGDNNVVPLCRGAHSLLDSWKRSEKSVEEEYGVEFRPMGDDLWARSPHRIAWERKQQDRTPTPTPDGSTGAAEDVTHEASRRMSASPGDQR